MGPRVSAICKVIHGETRECRLVRLTPTVRAALLKHDTHWAKRSKGGTAPESTDALLVTSQELWERLIPYFDFSIEVQQRGRHAPVAVKEPA
jgi:hypothetical protein